MARKRFDRHIVQATALILMSALILCACDSVPTDSTVPSVSESATDTSASDNFGDDDDFYFEDPYPVKMTSPKSSDGSDASNGSDNDGDDDGNDDAIDDDIGTATKESGETTPEPTYNPNIKEAGSGSFAYMEGRTKLHSETDVSMLIQPEDGTVYDFGARKGVQCTWIDSNYLRKTFNMKYYDASYRWLGYYNLHTSVSFKPYKEIGKWKTPKGNDYKLYLTEIYIISHNLEIRILPKSTNTPDNYTVSINGRGYYCSLEMLQMLDFVLSALKQKPYVDPLEGLYTGTNHIYYV